MTAAAQVFISYRRDDTAGYARALNDALAREFGDARVFIDVDDIHAGQAFDQTIAQAVQQARVQLVLIGPRWLVAHDGGAPRLHSPDDVVHQELAAGLAAGLQIIPLLFDGAAMPSEAQWPPPLRALARRQALVMDARRFASDTERLLQVLRRALGKPAPPAVPPARRAWLVGAGVAGLALLAGGLLWGGRSAPLPRAASPPAVDPPASAPRPAVNGRWTAEVVYDWPGANFREQLELSGEGRALAGSASFLRVPRGIQDGQVDADGLRFVTRSSELAGAGPEREVLHRYSGKLVGDELQLVMQTEGAAQPHQPVQIRARRVAP